MDIKKFNLRRLMAKAFSVLLLGIMLSSAFFPPIEASAHDTYFLGITVDKNSFKYMGVVGFDSNNLIASKHKEANIADFSATKIKNDSFSLKAPSLNDDLDKNKPTYKDMGVDDGDGGNGMIFSFPAIHRNGKRRWNASSVDMDRAYWVNDNLIAGLNEALSFVMNEIGFNRKASDAESEFMKLGVEVANAGYNASKNGSYSYSRGGKTFNFKRGTSSPANDINSNYYVTITVNGKSLSVPYKVEKGYQPGQPLDSTVPSGVKSIIKDTGSEGDAVFLTWKHVVLQAHYNLEVEGNGYDSITKIMVPSKIEGMLTELLSNVINGIRSFLGLYTLQELMLNTGQRAGRYTYGIMSTDWFKSSQTLHWVCQMIAWILLMGAMIKLLVKRNLASINPAMRVNLIEGIQDILLTGFLLTLIVPIFHALGSMNEKIVDVFGQSSIWIDAFGQNTSTSGLLSGVLLGVVYFVVMLYFNFVYIMRGIVVTILYATAPLFVVSIAFGGRYKILFGNWMKELVSNIFMQSFHAICLAFFSNANSLGNRGIEAMVLMFAFVPLTQFFRQSLMGATGGTAEKLGGQALSTGAGLVAGSLATSGANKAKAKPTTSTTAGNGNIATKSSDMLRKDTVTAKTSSANAMAGAGKGTASISGKDAGSEGIGKVSKFGDANDVIPDSVRKDSAFEDFSNSRKGKLLGGTVTAVGKTLKTGAKVGATVGKTAIGAGLAIGGTSVGSSQISAVGSQNLRKGASEISDGMRGIKDYGSGKIKEFLDSKSENRDVNKYVPGQEGFLYETDNGDGTIDYKHRQDYLMADTGISEIQDIKDSVQIKLAGSMKNGEFRFNDDFLNQGEEYENLKSMVNAYANPNDNKDAIKYYDKQGIKNVGVASDGSIVITRKKASAEVNSVNKSGETYTINKNNTAEFTNKSIYSIPKYESSSDNKKDKNYKESNKK